MQARQAIVKHKSLHKLSITIAIIKGLLSCHYWDLLGSLKCSLLFSLDCQSF